MKMINKSGVFETKVTQEEREKINEVRLTQAFINECLEVSENLRKDNKGGQFKIENIEKQIKEEKERLCNKLLSRPSNFYYTKEQVTYILDRFCDNCFKIIREKGEI